MKNYLVIFAFKGDHFYGTQKQKNFPSVQQLFESVLSNVYNEKIKFAPSSRLDRGVHAIYMGGNYLVNDDKIELDKIKYVLNRLLPDYIRVKEVIEVNEDFSSRYDAIKKTYLYRIHIGEDIDPFTADLMYHPIFKIDVNKLEEAAKVFVGTHDFKGFASSLEEKENTILTVDDCSVKTLDNEIQLRFSGKSFLRYQVRYMVGACIEYAQNRCTLQEIIERLEKGEYTKERYKAPGYGLYLENTIFDFERSKNV